MYFDGWECYFKIQKPTKVGLTKYEVFELTSALDCSPQRRYSRRAQSYSKLDIAKLRSKLCLSTFEVLMVDDGVLYGSYGGTNGV